MDFARVSTLLEEWGEPAYRSRQVYQAATRTLVADYDGMTGLPAALRRRLAEAEPLAELEVDEVRESGDGTIKLRLLTRDGFPVEAVAMRHRGRRTVCLSSQSGCPLACTFCATGEMGLGRSLRSGEIVEQLLALARILRDQDATVGNVVMMGMGEPFLNYDAVLDACRTMHDPDGFNLGARHIAISTAGWVPGIERLAEEPLPLRLALSLHAPTDELRERADARHPPVSDRAADGGLPRLPRAHGPAHLRRVPAPRRRERLRPRGAAGSGGCSARGPAFHVNLIAYNPTASAYSASPQERVAAFAEVLRELGVGASYRRSHGSDIEAACGQLAVAGARARRRALRRIKAEA